jgi:hypothetical protein
MTGESFRVSLEEFYLQALGSFVPGQNVEYLSQQGWHQGSLVELESISDGTLMEAPQRGLAVARAPGVEDSKWVDGSNERAVPMNRRSADCYLSPYFRPFFVSVRTELRAITASTTRETRQLKSNRSSTATIAGQETEHGYGGLDIEAENELLKGLIGQLEAEVTRQTKRAEYAEQCGRATREELFRVLGNGAGAYLASHVPAPVVKRTGASTVKREATAVKREATSGELNTNRPKKQSLSGTQSGLVAGKEASTRHPCLLVAKNDIESAWKKGSNLDGFANGTVPDDIASQIQDKNLVASTLSKFHANDK